MGSGGHIRIPIIVPSQPNSEKPWLGGGVPDSTRFFELIGPKVIPTVLPSIEI